MVVLDADTYATVGEIADTQGVHGIAVRPGSRARLHEQPARQHCYHFDLQTLKPIATVTAVTGPLFTLR